MFDGSLSSAVKAGTLPVWPVSGPDLVPPLLTIAQGNMTTNVASQTISGTVEAGATVTVTNNGGAPAAATVTGAAWSFTINPLAAGENTITVTAADFSENLSDGVDQHYPGCGGAGPGHQPGFHPDQQEEP